jgi:sarcosine oxidase
VVSTAVRDFRVAQVVVTAGPWLRTLVPDLPPETVRTPMTWFDPLGAPEPGALDRYALGRLPVFIRELDDGVVLWGHGATNGHGVKLGPEDDPGNFRPTDPDLCDRAVTPADWALVSRLAARALPGLDPTPSRTTTCMITTTPDRQFVLGRPRRDGRLVVGGGCSGHGFKHAVGIGEALARTVVGDDPFCDLGFTDPDRFL